MRGVAQQRINITRLLGEMSVENLRPEISFKAHGIGCPGARAWSAVEGSCLSALTRPRYSTFRSTGKARR